MWWVREMAEQLRASAAPPELLSAIPCNHLAAHNHLEQSLMPSSSRWAYMQVEHSYIKYIHKLNFLNAWM